MRWSVADSAVIAVVSFYLIQAPFTKVEESFSIQAIYDILKYGVVDISQYNHFSFPGAVPRSFVGPLIIACLSKPLVLVSEYISRTSKPITDFDTQLLVRCVIGLTNAISLIYLKNSAIRCLELDKERLQEEDRKRKEESRSLKSRVPEVNLYTVGNWFLAFTISSFHLMFYSSRPLPNFIMAFPLTNIVFSWILLGEYRYAIALCAIVATVFRIEVAALGIGLTLFSLTFKKITVFNALKFGIIGTLTGITISLVIDSYFWHGYCVPEIDAFIFNVVEGQASKWGVESPLAYFTHYLRLIYIPPTILLLCILGYSVAPSPLRITFLTSLFHILALSLQPHKEWRFIVYSLPMITLAGSVAAAYLWENINMNTTFKMGLISLLPLSPIISGTASLIFLFISKLNYPGGNALVQFNEMIVNNNITNVTVHMCVPAKMTGITLFGELNPDVYGVVYDASEDTQILREKWSSFDYLISAEPEASYLPFEKKPENNWELINTASMFGGINTEFLVDFFVSGNQTAYSICKDMLFNGSVTDNLNNFLDSAVRHDNVLFIYKRIGYDIEEEDKGTN
ncbi:hypothetical protein TPHA_0M01820 [Tetrapisispora phaffii CBS 4417]|uniref:Mannosyltransferase n=1 Tax=Tetrapisispora phaffii (strain ATCC 24235 / CBS 4417 / NBRC 1672 / NRRL Y-8282 / UCD 70-5) TaxID=1071381 RepID=G8C0P2_TETPH|nr:hypothetical protein TPHA_0M01820 [Tetrapisispora phaffii CBS 4417]CCE65757.1 hypothetical protein TPHA_0M01820 [Tetrapisispora phaffii CBS 4417]